MAPDLKDSSCKSGTGPWNGPAENSWETTGLLCSVTCHHACARDKLQDRVRAFCCGFSFKSRKPRSNIYSIRIWKPNRTLRQMHQSQCHHLRVQSEHQSGVIYCIMICMMKALWLPWTWGQAVWAFCRGQSVLMFNQVPLRQLELSFSRLAGALLNREMITTHINASVQAFDKETACSKRSLIESDKLFLYEWPHSIKKILKDMKRYGKIKDMVAEEKFQSSISCAVM